MATAPQVWTFYLYLLLAVIVFAVFAFVGLSTRRPGEVTPAGVNRLRLAFLVLLVVIIASALGFTLGRTPYALWAREAPDRLVFVAGKQFNFAVSERPIASDGDWQAATLAPAVAVRAGDLVEFRVSSLDVNHSVGIYDPAGVLVGQVQGMPGYLNRLRMRFDRPGRYYLLCLELCGHGHSNMRGVVDVLPIG
jgi:cytochrome c oxidase subunit 2